jgi:hypothetical protein
MQPRAKIDPGIREKIGRTTNAKERRACTSQSAREVLTMKLSRDQDSLAFKILAAMIAHSQIVVAQPAKSAPHFPAGFDEVDISILDWIAAEARRVGSTLAGVAS